VEIVQYCLRISAYCAVYFFSILDKNVSGLGGFRTPGTPGYTPIMEMELEMGRQIREGEGAREGGRKEGEGSDLVAHTRNMLPRVLGL